LDVFEINSPALVRITVKKLGKGTLQKFMQNIQKAL